MYELYERFGTPLKDWNIRINYGVKTGCNEAFIINEESRSRILGNCKNPEEKAKTDKIIRPILRGRDIGRDTYAWSGLYLICTFPAANINIDEYPSIKEYFESAEWSVDTPPGYGRIKLEQSGQTHIIEGKKVKSRKKTGNYWFETQDQIAYMDDFNKQKICYSETNSSVSTKIAIDRKAFITDKTCFIITSDDDSIIEQLYMVMNSPIFTWYMNLVSPKLGLSGISLTKDTVQLFPAVMSCGDKSVYSAYSLTEEEIVFISSSDSP